MRIIRFVTDDGHVLCGEDQPDGTVTVIRDLGGVLGAEPDAAPFEQLQGQRAVVADDDDNMRQMVCTVLEKAGCSTIACEDGHAAVAAIENEHVDLVVSDISMPGHDGYEVFSAARQQRPEMPVLLITGFGYDPNHTLIRASAAGQRGVLYKPFTPQQLLAELCKAINADDLSARSLLVQTEQRVSRSAMLAPVAPSNIICIGRNYAARPGKGVRTTPSASDAAEDLEVFMKPTTSLQASGESIRFPRFDDENVMLDCEGELALVIGTACQDETEEGALRHVLGYTLANDVTARRWQTESGPPQWMRGKGFDTFCPLGPSLVTADEIAHPDRLTITTSVNGRVIREGSTADMIRPLPRLLAELSRRLTLEPGTLILTGSPPRLPGLDNGSYLKPGDEVVVESPEIGKLTNRVVVT